MGFFSDLLDNARDKIESKLDAATEYLESTTIDENIADLKRAGGNAARSLGQGISTAAEYVKREAPNWQAAMERQREYQARHEERQYRRDMREFDRDMRELDRAIDDLYDD